MLRTDGYDHAAALFREIRRLPHARFGKMRHDKSDRGISFRIGAVRRIMRGDAALFKPLADARKHIARSAINGEAFHISSFQLFVYIL